MCVFVCGKRGVFFFSSIGEMVRNFICLVLVIYERERERESNRAWCFFFVL